MDVRRLPMARYLGVDPLPQPVIEIGTGVNDGVGVIGVGVIVDAHNADAQLVLAGGVLRRAADALLATDVTWSSRGRPWRGSHATMTPTQLANQLLDRGFRTQHLRFMSGLGYLQWQQQHVLIIPPHNYFAAPAGEPPFYMKRCTCCGAACPFCMGVFMYGSDHDGSDSDAPASSTPGDDDEEPDYDDEGSTTPPPRPRSPAVTMLMATRAFSGGAGPPTAGRLSGDDFGDDIWQSGDESGDERSRSRSPRHARRRVTTSQ